MRGLLCAKNWQWASFSRRFPSPLPGRMGCGNGFRGCRCALPPANVRHAAGVLAGRIGRFRRFLLRLKRPLLFPSGVQKEKKSGRLPNYRGRLRNYLGRVADDRGRRADGEGRPDGDLGRRPGDLLRRANDLRRRAAGAGRRAGPLGRRCGDRLRRGDDTGRRANGAGRPAGGSWGKPAPGATAWGLAAAWGSARGCRGTGAGL